MGIVVFGSFVVDLASRSKGLPQPGQTLLGSAFRMGAGGKGSNQAVAAHRAGAEVTLVTKVGGDLFGQLAMDFYQAEGMKTDYILRDAQAQTGIALILVDENTAQNEIVVVSGACGNITPQDVARCRDSIEKASLLLVQLEVNFDATAQAVAIAHAAGVPVVLNPAPASAIDPNVLAMVDIITPNETEAQILTGVAVHTQADAQRAAQVFFDQGVKQVVITLGDQGVFVSDGRRSQLLGRLPVQAVDTTGAGDAFNGGLAMALAEGQDLFTAVRWGNVTGALSVTKMGTAPAMPTREEMDRLYRASYGGE